MKTLRTLTALWFCLAAAPLAQAQNDKGQLGKLVANAVKSVGRIEFEIDNGLTGKQTGYGQAILIERNEGWFLTQDLPNNLYKGHLASVSIIHPADPDHQIKGVLLGSDPETAISFIAPADKEAWAKEKDRWKPLAFSSRSGLKIGQKVASVGLLEPSVGNQPYVGVGQVGALLEMPQKMVYVTGGSLTNRSSPVLTMDGRVVGLVSSQRSGAERMLIRGQWVTVRATDNTEARYFTPVEEFVHVLKNIPDPNKPETQRQLSWIGVLEFGTVLPVQADIHKLGDQAAVVVQQVFPGGPADKAGIKEQDFVVGVDGRKLRSYPTPQMTLSAFERDLITRDPKGTVTLTLWRDGQTVDVKVPLEQMPPRSHEAAHYSDRSLGMIVRDLILFDRHMGRSRPLLENGVVVLGVLPNAPAGKAKLQSGDLVTAVEKIVTPDVATFKKAIESLSASGKREVTFNVLRDEQPLALKVKLGQ
jgi:S1-C subfamily serine protease